MARKILLADDSVTAQNMGRKILSDAGYEVITVNNGSAALKKIAESKPELIVLDVYMPGYSGLEVCQRVKETRDTAHIPVLLTVGKLEPFKQDEARRVRADAFIIKPFEASELLAALGKLEDKVVSPPKSSGKDAKFANATMASFEKAASERGAQYGDEESGWKARLTIPSPGTRLPEPEPEPPMPSPVAFREYVEEKPQPPKVVSAPVMERPIPAGIPHDITPDEIAAITAAAARLSGRASIDTDSATKQESEPQAIAPPVTQAVGDEVPSVEAAKLDTPAVSPNQESATEVKPAETPVAAPLIQEAEKPAASVPPQAEPVAETAAAQTAPAPAEIEAALSSIAASCAEPAAPTPVVKEEPEPATVAAVASPATIAGPRWIAEEVPVEAAESVLVLEHEMHKAHAAFAAADHAATYEPAPVDKDDEPMFATLAPPAIGMPVPFATTEAQSAANPAPPAKEPEPAPVSFQDIRPAEVTKPPVPPITPPPVGTMDESHHGAPALGGPHLGGTEPSPLAATSETSTPVASAPADSRRESELAAATAATWANWKDIRQGAPAQKAETSSETKARAELEELKKAKGLKDETQPPPPQAAMAAAAAGDNSAADANLSSIVDHMLAELKPKLMAELAEKLKKEKK